MLINAHNITCIDVDDTLVYWNKNGNRPTVAIESPWETTEHLEYNENIINSIEQLSLRGFYIIIWSQSGADWCEKVAEALGIKDKISCFMTKPQFYYDDLPADAWMRRINP